MSGCVSLIGGRIEELNILKLIERGDFSGISGLRFQEEINKNPTQYRHLLEKIMPYTLHHDGYVRESAAFALGLLGDIRAEDSLITLLENESLTKGSWKGDNDWEAREEAARALAKIGSKKSLKSFEHLIITLENDVFVGKLKTCMTILQERLGPNELE